MWSLRDETRGASEVLGMILLVGTVLVAAIVAVSMGSAVLGDAEAQTDREQANSVLQDVDSELGSLTRSSDSTRIEIDFGKTNPGQYRIEQRGYLNITVNGPGGCSANIPLTSLRYEDGTGAVVAYEAGAVWRHSGDGGSTMVTRPSVGYTEGTIEVSLVNLTGVPDQAPNPVKYDPGKSEALTATYQNALTAEGCLRPDNATIRVQSDFHTAWSNYLESEFGVATTVNETNRTVELTLRQSDLPVRLNDSRNSVVNLSGAPYMDDVTITSSSISVDKGANNTYAVSVEPLHRDTPPIGNVSSIPGTTGIDGPPIDVVFVMDESGSMGDPACGSCTDSKAEAAEEAAQRFVGRLNASEDRAGVTFFDTNSRYGLTTNNEYITSDFSSSGVNGSIDSIGASGGTRADKGIELANNVFDLHSNETRKEVMILLSDGANNVCKPADYGDDTLITNGIARDCGPNSQSLDLTQDAAANGVTVYTVGYGNAGNELDEAFLKRTAEIGGGEYYHVTDDDQLEDAFEDIRESITETDVVLRSPVSANFTTGGTVFGPVVPGNDDHVAHVTINGHDFKNINDPTSSGQYSFAFAADGGDDVTMEAYDYECANDGWTDTGRTVDFNGTIYTVARCTNVTSNTTVPPDDILIDGDTLPSEIHTGVNYSTVWQEDINATFGTRGDIGINGTSGELQLKSNQALLYYDLPDSANSANHLLLLYDIGVAESEARGIGAINIDVDHVEFG